MKIIFVTGKGGVGKSTVAAAIAWKAAKLGQRTLLVELGDQSFYQDYFSVPGIGYNALKLQENLDVAQWSGHACLQEYALFILKLKTLYKLFFENPISRALINVAPGLPELSIMGKITSGPPRNSGPKLDYDYIVVDAFSSGHFLALIRAPRGMSEAISFGPMGEQSRSIDRVIKNPQICEYVIATLPEELPMIETAELAQGIQEFVGFAPKIVLNKCLPEVDVEGVDLLPGGFESYYGNKIQMQKKYAQQKSMLKLPFIFSNNSWQITEQLAGAYTS